MLLFSASVILESLLAIGQFLKQGSIGGILYFLGERTFTGSTPGIANASLNGELVLRPYATFPHPNVMAGFLLVSMILVLGFLLNSKRHCEALKWLWQSLLTGRFKKDCFASLAMTAALILGTIALFLSMSRIAILLWVVIICYYFIKKIIYSSSKRSASRSSVIPAKAGIHPSASSGGTGPRIKSGMTRFVGVPFCIVAIAVFIFSPLGLRFTKIANTDEAVVQREVLISSSIKMIESSPLFGVGLGNFIPVLSKIQKPLSLGLYLQPVHNIFLLVASETGIVGLTFFLWFLWKTFRQLFTRHCEAMKRPRQSLKIWDCFASLAMTSEGVLLVAFSAILILGLFDHYWLTLQQGQLLFGFILGMCWAKIDKA
ncbi:MAG TPA: O-antigen ligase family protein [Candidatus Saccharimonadales bacterium]|nr:O-antigen ligase family protein [Candidatus Saccharimonadales bacterium]